MSTMYRFTVTDTIAPHFPLKKLFCAEGLRIWITFGVFWVFCFVFFLIQNFPEIQNLWV